MSVRASVIVPSPGATAPLEGLWAALEPTLSLADELILVDASGRGVLAEWAEAACPRARVLSPTESLDPAAAYAEGADQAQGDFLVGLAPAVRVEPGFLDALLAVFEEEGVGLATPRLECDGAVVSSVAVEFEDGRLHVVSRDLGPDPALVRPVPFASEHAFALRRETFAGFDRVIAPLGWWDVDLGLSVWRGGRRVVEVPSARARLDEEDAPGQLPPAVVHASSEKNRLLTLWKHLDHKADAHDHVASLWRDALDAALGGRREELIWIALALQELPQLGRSRAKLEPARLGLRQVLRVSDPAR